jgi:hypothetical protein
MGTAAHFALHMHVDGHSMEDGEVAQIYDVDPTELGVLASLGRRCWAQVRDFYQDAHTELHMRHPLPGVDGYILDGTADVVSEVQAQEEIRVLDWKTGREDYDHGQQLRGYGWLALQQAPWATFAHVAVVRVREQTIDRDRFSRMELDAWAERLGHQLAETPRYQPGEHCRFCPHGGDCPAKTAMMRQAIESILIGQVENTEGEHFPPAIVGRLFDRLRLAEKACEDIRGLVRAEVARAGGTLAIEGGRELRLTEQRQRRILPSALSILIQTLGHSGAQECLTVSKTKVEKAVGETAPRGKKSERIKQFLAVLEDDGHVGETIVERLEVRRSAASITHEVTR